MKGWGCQTKVIGLPRKATLGPNDHRVSQKAKKDRLFAYERVRSVEDAACSLRL